MHLIRGGNSNLTEHFFIKLVVSIPDATVKTHLGGETTPANTPRCPTLKRRQLKKVTHKHPHILYCIPPLISTEAVALVKPQPAGSPIYHRTTLDRQQRSTPSRSLQAHICIGPPSLNSEKVRLISTLSTESILFSFFF